MDNGTWVCLKASAPAEYLDDVSAVMSMISNSLMVEDYRDIEEELLDGVYGDLIDEELLKADKTKVSVCAYIEASSSPAESESYIKERFGVLGIPAEVSVSGVSEEDWADSWKQYYKPIKTGDKLVIVPVWESYTPAKEEIVVLMDPGMAFGTGSHETTRLCAAFLEKYVSRGMKVLDVGCGSGILAVCAAKLGAGECFACDIDKCAVKVAGENTVINNTPQVKVAVSDLLKNVDKTEGGYDIIVANIVADVIIRMSGNVSEFLAPEGCFIVSGIIDSRTDEVISALTEAGFEIVDSVTENGWYAGVCKKAHT